MLFACGRKAKKHRQAVFFKIPVQVWTSPHRLYNRHIAPLPHVSYCLKTCLFNGVYYSLTEEIHKTGQILKIKATNRSKIISLQLNCCFKCLLMMIIMKAFRGLVQYPTNIYLYVNVSDNYCHIVLIIQAKKNRTRGQEQKENLSWGCFSFSTFTNKRLGQKEMSHFQYLHTEPNTPTLPAYLHAVKSRSLTSVTLAQVQTWCILSPGDRTMFASIPRIHKTQRSLLQGEAIKKL